MSFNSRRPTRLVLLGLSALAIGVVHATVDGTMRDGIGCLLAALAVFRFGAPLQRHAIGSLRRFRVTARTLIWISSCVAFWYSTAIWLWWARRTPTFPLFLLNSELETTVFFFWVPLLILVGLLLGPRSDLTV